MNWQSSCHAKKLPKLHKSFGLKLPINFCFVGPPIFQYSWTKTKIFWCCRSNSVKPQISESKDEPRLAHTWIGKAHVTLENCPNQMPTQLGSNIIWKSIWIHYYIFTRITIKSSSLQIFPMTVENTSFHCIPDLCFNCAQLALSALWEQIY